MKAIKLYLLSAALGIASVGVCWADPVPQPLAKTGSCPSGYSTSGAYCTPGRDARYAVPKVGSCPSGYSTSGGYCLAGRDARLAVPKVGSCPSGYSTSGDYCLQTSQH